MADGAELVELGTVALPEDYIFDFSFPEDGKPSASVDRPDVRYRLRGHRREVLSERDPECADQMQENFEAFAGWPRNSPRPSPGPATFPRGPVADLPRRIRLLRELRLAVVGAVQPSDLADRPCPKSSP